MSMNVLQRGQVLHMFTISILTDLFILRHYGSRESVSIPVSALGSLDLSADTSTVIRPVHSSILGEKYCFEVHVDSWILSKILATH